MIRRTIMLISLTMIIYSLNCTSYTSLANEATSIKTAIVPPPQRELHQIENKFVESEMNIKKCILASDSIIPINETRNFLFINNCKGNFYVGKITKPEFPKNILSWTDEFQECISKKNWTDSIPDNKLNTLINAKITRNGIDSIHLDTFSVSYSICGGRSKQNIMSVVNEHVSKLRSAYNRKIAFGFKGTGKVTVKFAINEFGKIIFCKVIESTLNNLELENEIQKIIWKWKFAEILCPGDVTEVIYPFIFAM